MSAVDKVLAALDAGLQSSDEHGYPERIDDPTCCARCLLHEPVEDGFCSGCRSFLLGDSDEDPRLVHPQWTFSVSENTTPPSAYPGHFQARGPVRVQRLDRDGNPTGVPEDLRGYVVHHVNGDSRDNRMENLRVMPATENQSIGWARHQSTDDRWIIDFHGYGHSGRYHTDDPRPFTVAEYVSGPWRGVQLLNADDSMVAWSAYASHESRPAAFRVSSSIAVPEYYAVTCGRCGAMYAVDPERTMEGRDIIANDGHGTGGSCDPLTHTRAEVTEGHDAEATDAPPGWLAHPRQRRDWQAEALAWARQGRRWLGL